MRYILVSEGSSDRMLIGPIEWALGIYCQDEFSGEWANPAALDDRSRVLQTRLEQVENYFPCDIAFVHRDTDAQNSVARRVEIQNAINLSGYPSPVVCTIPVRMTEAWFLFDEMAIRRAAGKPSGTVGLRLPSLLEVARRADPKEILENALVTASETAGRRRDKFRSAIGSHKLVLSRLIDDFSDLRTQGAFQDFEGELRDQVAANGWGINRS